MTSFVGLHHVRLKAFIDFVVELLWWVDGGVDVVVVVLDQRVPRRMRQSAGVVACVVNVREIVALLVTPDTVRQCTVDWLLLCAACWSIWCVSFLR